MMNNPNKSRLDQLNDLRKAATKLQNEFLDLLCTGDDDETKLEKSFCFFLWEIDEASRQISKVNPRMRVQSTDGSGRGEEHE